MIYPVDSVIQPSNNWGLVDNHKVFLNPNSIPVFSTVDQLCVKKLSRCLVDKRILEKGVCDTEGPRRTPVGGGGVRGRVRVARKPVRFMQRTTSKIRKT